VAAISCRLTVQAAEPESPVFRQIVSARYSKSTGKQVIDFEHGWTAKIVLRAKVRRCHRRRPWLMTPGLQSSIKRN
jgi:hypothetical protein